MKEHLRLAVFLLPLVAQTGAVAGEITPVDQAALNAGVAADPDATFLTAFDAGDELTEFSFTAREGVGANVGEGRRFSRIPRADLDDPGEWAMHVPTRETGPNATSCIACHIVPAANGAGDVALNAILDPRHTGDPALFLERNTPHLFALGIPQNLAEEMSSELLAIREAARARACADGGRETARLVAKGVEFGSIVAVQTEASPCKVHFDTSLVEGVDDDLIIRPFGWKGERATIRDFTRNAAHNELGLQPVELVGAADGDFDGVTHELTVGDITALVVYMAGLERPVNVLELAELGLAELPETDRAAYLAGAARFNAIGCGSCHVPEMVLEDTNFSEPSDTFGYFDVVFPDGSDPKARGLDAATAVSFDLAADQPNNRIEVDGRTVALGALTRDDSGRAIARWYTDFRRHDMGAELADPDDPQGLGAAVFMTRSLAGVGSTGPWLHDGRATSLEAAILAHGGAAAAARAAYAALDAVAREEIVAYLEGQIIVTLDEEDD